MIVESFRAFEVAESLLRGELREFHAVFCAVELSHVGNYLDARDEFAFLHRLAGFFEDFGHNARNLGFDIDFNAGLYRAGHDGAAVNVGAFHFDDLKALCLWTRFLIEEDKSADEQGNDKHDAEDFEGLFHCDVGFHSRVGEPVFRQMVNRSAGFVECPMEWRSSGGLYLKKK